MIRIAINPLAYVFFNAGYTNISREGIAFLLNFKIPWISSTIATTYDIGSKKLFNLFISNY